MERRRQKFQSGVELVIPTEEKCKLVSLASLKSSSSTPSSSNVTEVYLHESSESMHSESKKNMNVVLVAVVILCSSSNETEKEAGDDDFELSVSYCLFICRAYYHLRLITWPSGRHTGNGNGSSYLTTAAHRTLFTITASISITFNWIGYVDILTILLLSYGLTKGLIKFHCHVVVSVVSAWNENNLERENQKKGESKLS